MKGGIAARHAVALLKLQIETRTEGGSVINTDFSFAQVEGPLSFADPAGLLTGDFRASHSLSCEST